MLKRVLLVFFAFILLCNKGYSQNDPPSEMALLAKDGKHDGLQIDRKVLIKGLKGADSTLNFKEQLQANKIPELIAHGIGNSNVKVIGTENNLREVGYEIFIITGDRESIKSAFTQIGHLIAVVIPRRELNPWLLKQYYSVNLTPLLPVRQSYSISANLLTFIYDPPSKSIKLTIATEYN